WALTSCSVGVSGAWALINSTGKNMAGIVQSRLAHGSRTKSGGLTPPLWLRGALIGASLVFLFLVLLLPLCAVFFEAFRKGWEAFADSFMDPDAIHAIKLTLLVAAIAVPLNTAFGLCGSWAIAKHDFPGKSFLLTLIDLPFA